MRTCRANPLSRSKIKTTKELKSILKQLKAKGKKIVFTNGCFDLLHYGHIKYLEDAKIKGDILVVAINTDSSVKKIKGLMRPIISQADRARTVAGLESVDYVFLFNEKTPLRVIRLLKPDILVKGADWNKKNIAGAQLVSDCGGSVYTVKLVKNRSTSNLIKKIVKAYSRN